MGVLQLEHMGGRVYYECKDCKNYLTNKKNLYLDSTFHGHSGPAWLCKKVVNVKFGPPESKNLRTGAHYVSNISCKKCDRYLGWYYELAKNKSQEYKEGKFVLERSYLQEQKGTTKK